MKWILDGFVNMDFLKFISVMVTTVCQCSIGVDGLRATELRIIPQTVERSKDVTLICLYNLHSDPLYSVKWYRGQHEFYRYSPTEEPQTKIFPFFGINVDLARSNESQVVLVRVGFLLSGNFSCEVTADAPSFSTSVVSSYLEVIGLPQWPPKMSSEHEQYAPGDVLRANCTAAPARPPANLMFYINDRPIRTSRSQTMPAGAGLHWSHLTLSLQLLPAHYDRGPPLLRCEASIADVYRQSSQMVLYLPNAGPKNERVTSTGISRGPHNDLVIFLTLLYLFPPA